MSTTVRNTSLDTLRALAITLVVFCHATLSYGTPNSLDWLALGGVGVDLFFCLSGWLLGRLLCLEFQRTGTIDVRRFWLRRWMRTLPAYYAVLLLTMAQLWFQQKLPVSWPYFVFLQNYLGAPFFGVSWSLCVEEYFYLLVAPLLLLCLRRRTAMVILPFIFAIPFVSRLATPWVASHWGWQWHLEMTHLRYDQCAIGVLVAAISVFLPRVWKALCQASVVLAPVGLAAWGLNFYWRAVHSSRGDWSLLEWSAIFASLVVLANSSDFWRRRAQIPGARYLADRAYAIYLLHVEGIAVMNRLSGFQSSGVRIPLWLYIVGVWLVALIAAEGLYRLIERPVMQARERLAASRSPETTEGAQGKLLRAL